ncbi:MAG: amidohydrolase family protein [Acidobacteria bacterium]|nr:amidohydrolase family protein [Acidobacteriota bacterium]
MLFRLKFSALFIFVLTLFSVPSFSQEAHYSILIMANTAGEEVITIGADGARRYTYEYNDRGRGPKTTTAIRLDENGVPVFEETKGVDYLKAPVNETYSYSSGTASWSNSAEKGSQKLSANPFYISMNGPGDELALLARAILKAPGSHLATLPTGDATIQEARSITVNCGPDQKSAALYFIRGLGADPIPVWLDDRQNYFGQLSSWQSSILKGCEAAVPLLLAMQDEFDTARQLKIAHDLTRKPAGPVAITNVSVFDSVAKRSIPNSTVIIEGDRIKQVGSAKTVKVPKGTEIVDGRGKTLIPGLWDMHVHTGPGQGLYYIAGGVTSVRDLGNDNDTLQAIKARVDSGDEIGPRVLMRALIDGRGPYTGPTKNLVDTEDEARAIIDKYAALHYDGIKIYSSIKPELVPKIVEMAHARGLRVSGHVPAFMNAEQFVRDGVDEIQHVNFLFLNFFDDVKDTRTPARFTTVADRAASLDLNSKRVRDFIQLLKERNIVSDPTINVFENMFTARPGQVSPDMAAVADRLPPLTRRGLLSGGLPVPEGKDQTYRDSVKALERMVKLLYDNGITIVAGTDSAAGFGLHRELELYVDAGIPPAEVLSLATIGAARVMKRDSELGSIEPGKLADMVLINGDPTLHIGDIRRTARVFKGGNIYDPAQLYTAVGIKPSK